MPARRVIFRPDRAVSDDSQVLVRFGRDVDVPQALRVALGASPLYRVLPGFDRAGAVCVSAFIVRDEVDAVAILADTVWDHYGLATAGTLRRAGYQIIGTDIEDEGELIPHSDRHVDVVVCPYPETLVVYDQLSRAERRALRERLARPYERALRLFDPRRGLDQKPEVP
jgi:hypothetical protein